MHVPGLEHSFDALRHFTRSSPLMVLSLEELHEVVLCGHLCRIEEHSRNLLWLIDHHVVTRVEHKGSPSLIRSTT